MSGGAVEATYRAALRAEDGNGVLPEPVYREHRNRWMTVEVGEAQVPESFGFAGNDDELGPAFVASMTRGSVLQDELPDYSFYVTHLAVNEAPTTAMAQIEDPLREPAIVAVYNHGAPGYIRLTHDGISTWGWEAAPDAGPGTADHVDLSSCDLSKVRIALFVGCHTADTEFGTNGNLLQSAWQEGDGVEVAVGFHEGLYPSIGTPDAGEVWSDTFWSFALGYETSATVHDAAEEAWRAVLAQCGSTCGYDSVDYSGNEYAILYPARCSIRE